MRAPRLALAAMLVSVLLASASAHRHLMQPAELAAPGDPQAAPLAGVAETSLRDPTGNGHNRTFRCSAPVYSQEKKRSIDRQVERSLERLGPGAPPFTGPVTIDTYFHVMYDGTDNAGNIPQAFIDDQIAVLNRFFGGRFVFNLKETNRVDNANYHYNLDIGNLWEFEMKSAYRRGGAKDLNFYTANLARTGDLLGWAAFPFMYAESPILDGVVVDAQALTGGRINNYNLGAVSVHEVGHWLGLFHTFWEQGGGGCDFDNDDVVDTPSIQAPNFYCPARGVDSCPNLPGLDAVNNFMDYTYDACKTRFSPGQFTRMSQHWAAFRMNK